MAGVSLDVTERKAAEERQELLARTYYFTDIGEAAGAPPDTRLIMYVEGDVIAAAEASGLWAMDAIVRDVDGREAAAILRKLR